MLNVLVIGTRIAVVIFSLAVILSLSTMIPRPYASYIVWLGGLVAAIHFVQYLFISTRGILPKEGISAFVNVMLFGFTHWLPHVIGDNEGKQ